MIATTSSNNQYQHTNCPVNSYNEWDLLEKVIVGTLDNAVLPPNHISVQATVPKSLSQILMFLGSRRYPQFLIKQANKELKEFIHILESEGVKVRRPDIRDFSITYKTPYWSSKGLSTILFLITSYG